MKKRPVDDEEGKEKVDRMMQEENDAIRSFFFKPAAPAPEKRKKSKVLELAVPLTESVPAVKEREASGAGTVVNPFTGKSKKVSQGKHATKGRGTVTDAIVQTRPLPPMFPMPIHFAQLSVPSEPTPLIAAQTTPFEEEVDYSAPVHNDTKAPWSAPLKAVATVTATVTVPAFLAAPSLAKVLESQYNDGIQPGKPTYTDDAWSEAKIKAIRKDYAKRKKDVPAFFLRRDTYPEDFLLPPLDTTVVATLEGTNNKKRGPLSEADLLGPTQTKKNVQYALESNNADPYKDTHMDQHCKLLTFNCDGDYKWPQSSPHKCWNCCHTFEGPPAMIPRHFNKVHKYYEVYGNFCGWSCAKLFAQDSQQEYFSDKAPSLDYFAHKYFSVMLPIPCLPPRYVLDSFSGFGMTIEEYRAIGRVIHKPLLPQAQEGGDALEGTEDISVNDNYRVVHPPCVPYELFVLWQKRNPQKIQMKKGYDLDKRRHFEQKMGGARPINDMPAPIAPGHTTLPDFQTGRYIQSSTSASKKKKQKNLLSLLPDK